jgi:hypothetical protein
VSQANLKENYMRHLVLTTVAMAILTIGVWGQSSQAQTPTPGPAANDKKAPEGKSGKHHHHHKHHHNKQAAQH